MNLPNIENISNIIYISFIITFSEQKGKCLIKNMCILLNKVKYLTSTAAGCKRAAGKKADLHKDGAEIRKAPKQTAE